MALDDLDLEFEDEEESKKKKNEAVQVDVDLDFAVPEGAKPRPAPTPQARPQAAPSTGRPAEVRKIDEARAASSAPRPAPQARPQNAPAVSGSSALKVEPGFDLESANVVEMREQVRKMEVETQVKVAVAEFKTEYLTEMLSDMKLVQHQVEQLLVRINAKHPDMKNEVLMIKKILADFTAKKRK